MSYDYWKAGLSLRKSPNVEYKDNWENFVEKQFNNAYNWFDIEEETDFGSNIFEKIKVRVTSAINPTTGTNLSDDWKMLIFNIGHKSKVGTRYRYFDNIWMSFNTEAYSSPSDNCIIRRCNNFLTMVDVYNVKHIEPCIIDYNLDSTSIYFNNSVNVPQGVIKVYIQMNKYTKNIERNNRYIIGYNEVYKVKSIRNFLNDETLDKDSSPLIKIDMLLDSEQIGDNFIDNTTGSSGTVPSDSKINIISITPLNYTIPQGVRQIYTCKYIKLGVETLDIFTFTVNNNNIPSDRYLYEYIDGNNFAITNYRKYTKDQIIIQCKDIVTNVTKNFNFTLGGDI